MKRHIMFDTPDENSVPTEYAMKISQNIGGNWVHIFTTDVMNTEPESELTQRDLEVTLKEYMNTIYNCEKVQLGADLTGVIFYPPQGPINIEIFKKA